MEQVARKLLVHELLRSSPLEKWVLSHDRGRYYGLVTKNFSEGFNSVLTWFTIGDDPFGTCLSPRQLSGPTKQNKSTYYIDTWLLKISKTRDTIIHTIFMHEGREGTKTS